MEKESFEDEETARLMNDIFVSIKVDREERTDIDNIYMLVCQMMTGNGGWPLSIVTTPDKKPFFAGTYFPRESKYGSIGFKNLIKNINDVWKNKQKEIEESSDQIISYLNQTQTAAGISDITAAHMEDAYNNFLRRFDTVHGGFGTSPKFPSPHNLMFLLRYWKRTANQNALDMVTKTLTGMRNGGIYDHAGFGFHRYSTDDRWLVPHFEKMLYDQALLIFAYTEAFQATQNPEFKKTAGEIITYLFRDMTSPHGAFFSAEDADSEGIEGKFYVWTKDELADVPGNNDAEIAAQIFNVTAEGNFHVEDSRQSIHSNILHLTKSTDELSSLLNLTVEELQTKIENIRTSLFAAREKRIHPYKDDKSLTGWNCLTIAALAKAGKAFGNKTYIIKAEQAFEFIETKLTDSSGSLLHRYRNGEAKLPGTLDDYAFLIWAAMELYEATFEKKYIDKTVRLTDYTIKHFYDEVNGGFYFAADYAEKLIVRIKEFYDGAVPSGNSVMIYNLLKLNRFTANSFYEDIAKRSIDFFSSSISNAPSGSSFIFCALEFLFGTAHEIIVASEKFDSAAEFILEKLNKLFLPDKILIFLNGSNQNQRPEFDYLANYKTLDGKPTIYVCKNFICSLPANDLSNALFQPGIVGSP